MRCREVWIGWRGRVGATRMAEQGLCCGECSRFHSSGAQSGKALWLLVMGTRQIVITYIALGNLVRPPDPCGSINLGARGKLEGNEAQPQPEVP